MVGYFAFDFFNFGHEYFLLFLALLKKPLSKNRLGITTDIMDDGRTLLDSEAPPWLVYGDWAISEMNENPDLRFRFACL